MRALSPAIEGAFPQYLRALGGRQSARSLHFIGLVLFLVFLVGYVIMVILHGFAAEMNRMVLGRTHGAGAWEAAWLGLGILAAVALANLAATFVSWRASQRTHDVLALAVDLVRVGFLRRLKPRQHYPESMISPFMRVNGRPPTAEYPVTRNDEFIGFLEHDFVDWRLAVVGLVEHPLSLSLDELRAMPRTDQVTLHNCVQGWTAIAKWSGAPLSEVLDRCKPRPGAKYLVFHSYQRHEEGGGKHEFYECIDLEMARHPQTILAYEMNGKPLPMNYGRPLRLRVETVIGYKMVKWIRSIEFIEDYRAVGAGRGGSREDVQLMGQGAEV